MDKIVSEIKEHIDGHFDNFNKDFQKHEQIEFELLKEHTDTMKSLDIDMKKIEAEFEKQAKLTNKNSKHIIILYIYFTLIFIIVTNIIFYLLK